jgi:transmembrane sensor
LHRSPIAALAATLAVVTIGILVWYLQRDSVTTAIGEQRTITLDDGSRIFLNTDTRAVVQYSSGERRIRLDKGEALFEVAKQAGRPFIVAAGMARIEALGTSFVVRRDPQRLAVTLVDGKVSVASMETGEQTPPLEQARILSPGERLTIARRGAPILDAPRLDKLTAWQQGQIAFDSVPLADAVAEMNRYGATKLFIERPEAAGIHIGGIFRTGDAVSFAAAMVETYQLKAVEERGRIILAGAPKTPGISKRRPK